MSADPDQTTTEGTSLKEIYAGYHDSIIEKRYNSPYWLRRYAHRQIHAQFLPYLQPGQLVLDAGCGEGVLSCLIAQRGVEVIGAEISGPNLEGAARLAQAWGVAPHFLRADAENLPFPDNSFDVVVSSHVLEHLPHFQKGLQEIYRLTRDLALIAMPTALNPGAWLLLGGDNFWKFHFRRRTLYALVKGIAKTIRAWRRKEEGPDELYAGKEGATHIWRFPGLMRRHLEKAGFVIERFEAGPLILFPFLAQRLLFMRDLQVALDRHRARPLLRNFGYGSMAVCRKKK